MGKYRSKNVALTLGCGGARGLSHIGAIEELEDRGYTITSVSGSSSGGLIAGICAAGKIHEAHDWFSSLETIKMLSLLDPGLGLCHLIKGDRIIRALREWIPDVPMETLDVDAALVATDFLRAKQVVFREGSLIDAIRATISIPLLFEPLHYNGTLLVDGGTINPFPLDVIHKKEDDLFIGINITDRCTMTARWNIGEAPEFLNLLGPVGRLGEKYWYDAHKEASKFLPPSLNFVTMINRFLNIQMQSNAQLMQELYKPDLLVHMEQDTYGLFDFVNAAEIIELGRTLMADALDRYENNILENE